MFLRMFQNVAMALLKRKMVLPLHWCCCFLQKIVFALIFLEAKYQTGWFYNNLNLYENDQPASLLVLRVQNLQITLMLL